MGKIVWNWPIGDPSNWEVPLMLVSGKLPEEYRFLFSDSKAAETPEQRRGTRIGSAESHSPAS